MTLDKYINQNCQSLRTYDKYSNYCKKKKLYTTIEYCESYCGDEY